MINTIATFRCINKLLTSSLVTAISTPTQAPGTPPTPPAGLYISIYHSTPFLTRIIDPKKRRNSGDIDNRPSKKAKLVAKKLRVEPVVDEAEIKHSKPKSKAHQQHIEVASSSDEDEEQTYGDIDPSFSDESD